MIVFTVTAAILLPQKTEPVLSACLEKRRIAPVQIKPCPASTRLVFLAVYFHYVGKQTRVYNITEACLRSSPLIGHSYLFSMANLMTCLTEGSDESVAEEHLYNQLVVFCDV